MKDIKNLLSAETAKQLKGLDNCSASQIHSIKKKCLLPKEYTLEQVAEHLAVRVVLFPVT